MDLTAKAWVRRCEPRLKVLIRIRVRSDGPPCDACIRDVSSRGMLVQTARSPKRGTIVELLGPFSPMVGSVIWSSDRRFGIQLRDRLDVSGLLEGRLDRRKFDEAATVGHRPGNRRSDWAKHLNHHIGRLLQYAAVVLIGTGLAVGLAGFAHETLSRAAVAIAGGMDHSG